MALGERQTFLTGEWSTKRLRWAFLALCLAFAGIVVDSYAACACSAVLITPSWTRRGQALTAVAQAQEAIYRRHGRYATSENELAAALPASAFPNQIQDLHVLRPIDASYDYVVRFQSQGTNVSCKVARGPGAIDTVRRVTAECKR